MGGEGALNQTGRLRLEEGESLTDPYKCVQQLGQEEVVSNFKLAFHFSEVLALRERDTEVVE